MSDEEWRPDPKFRAHRYDLAFCGDPLCGIHIVGIDHNNKPMCEIVMPPSQTLHLVKYCQSGLYDKATERDN